MAKFLLETGELKQSEHRVELAVERKAVPASVIITDQRVVVVPDPPTPRWAFGFGALSGLIVGLLAALDSEVKTKHVSHQIHRQRFAEVEESDGQIVLHDDGEGYDHTSFAFRSKESFATWQERMHRWAAGTADAAPLPTARLVDPDR